jgi:hypothetical protein
VSVVTAAFAATLTINSNAAEIIINFFFISLTPPLNFSH